MKIASKTSTKISEGMHMARIAIAQVTQNGEGFIALIIDDKIVARFADWNSARRAYRIARTVSA